MAQTKRRSGAWRRIEAMRRRRRRQRIKRLTIAGASLLLVTSFASFATTRSIRAPEPQQEATVTASAFDITEAAQETTEAPLTEPETEAETERPHIASTDWGAEDSYLLAKIAMAEAEGEDTEGKALVILTVLNRVWAPQFPGTIEAVITQPNAFTSYWDGRWNRVEPDEDCYAALHKVQVEHWDESQGALYFERSTAEDTWHSRNLVKLFDHGNHTFYTEKEVGTN